MAYIEPNTTVKFLQGVPFDPDYENTMYFATAADQETYMNGKAVLTINKNSYQRKSRGVLKVGYVVDTISGSSMIRLLYNANYMMFRNDNFENKWFYAFVTNVEYVNNNTVEVYYSIDVVQTWLFAFNFNQCLIEREHTVTDNVGDNLLPEDLERGEYVFNQAEKVTFTPIIVLATNFVFDSNDNPTPVMGKLYYGRAEAGSSASNPTYYSGVAYLPVNPTDATALSLLNQLLSEFTEENLTDGVMGLMMAPAEFFSSDGSSVSPITKAYTVPTSLGSYTPRNKKLLTWPYCGCYVSTMDGNGTIFPYEYFVKDGNGKIDLVFWGNMSMNPGVVMYPAGYKTATLVPNYDECMSISGFPPCCYGIDAYKAWWAQNAGAMMAKSGSALLGSLTGGINSLRAYSKKESVYTEGAVHSTVSGGVSSAFGLLGEIADHVTKPPQTEGNMNGDLMYQAGLLGFLVGTKHIREEFARIIDSFFDMYGYATHRVGTPNLNARPCYSYVKTVGASIDGNLPATDCQELQNIFNRGIRFWKTTATFGSFDPSVNNNSPT